jgi:WD40 repeat protein
VERLAFHPGGQWLAVAAWDSLTWGAVRPDGLRLVDEGAHRALAIASEGNRLAYAPSNEELGLCEVALPTSLVEWEPISPPAQDSYMVVVGPNGEWAVSATGNSLHLWDAQARRQIASRPLPAKPSWVQLLVGPSEDFLYYSSESFGIRRIELVRTNTSQGTTQLEFGREQLIGEPSGFMAIGFASDGRSVVVGQYHQRLPNERVPPTVWLWADGHPGRARKLTADFPLVGYRVVPGDRWAVTTDLVAPDVWIWDFQTGERVRNLGLPMHVSSEPLANGRWLATRTRQEFALWEVGTWRPLARWLPRPEEQGGGSLKSSPDSRLLVSRTPDGKFILRELPSGAELITLAPPRSTAVASASFSPDSKRLIVLLKNGRIVEWNLAEIRGELARLGLDWQSR